MDCANLTFEIFFAEVEQDNANISAVILINNASYNSKARQLTSKHRLVS